MHPLSATQAGRERLADRHAAAAGSLPPAQLQGQVRPVLGDFRLLRQLGQGRRSVAWLAHDMLRDAPAVLKVAQRRGADGSPFAREFGIGSDLRHPNVVALLEHGSAGGMPYLAMEYIGGGDLAQRLQQSMGQAEALACLRDAAAGLAQLHRRGLVHRDVKPANLLLRADGSAVLADFGLAVAVGSVDPAAQPGAIVGTPRYVAPEQLQGAPARPAADIYSLGVVLHHMLAGSPPFRGQTLMEVLSQQLVAVAPRLPESRAALQPLCDAMLAKEPRERLPNADAVLARIAMLQTDLLPVPAGPSGKRWSL
jgi:serine/threonine-protein kinase PpkA